MKSILMLLLFLPTLMLGAEPTNTENIEAATVETLDVPAVEALDPVTFETFDFTNTENTEFFILLKHFSVSVDCEGDGIVDYYAGYVAQEHVGAVVQMFLDAC